MEEKNAIILKNVSKSFNLDLPLKFLSRNHKSKKIRNQKLLALDNISFEVKKGEMLGIIGLNGSGKTTLLRTIAGIYKPDSGSVTVNGMTAPILQIGTGFHPELNAIENILMSGMILGMSKAEIKQKTDNILEFAELEEFAYVKLKKYSSGMRARLAFSTAFQIDPDILLVDEVLAVGDKRFKEKSFTQFSTYKKRGKTILYTTHSIEQVYKLIDRVVVMDHGKIVVIGSPEEAVKKYEEIIQNYKKSS